MESFHIHYVAFSYQSSYFALVNGFGSLSINTALFFVPDRRKAFRGAYSGELYQLCASSRLGNSISTGKVGRQFPSTISHLPPTRTYFPPYLLTVAKTPLLYCSNFSGSVTSYVSKKQYAAIWLMHTPGT
jgi:hypothetical protein